MTREDNLQAREQYADEMVAVMDSDKKRRAKVFKEIYGGVYPQMHKDWENDSHEKKLKFVKKYMANEDFMNILSMAQLNKFNFRKTWKDMKEYGKRKKQED